jgi:protein TonB
MATRALLLSRDEQAVDALVEALGALDCGFEHSSETTFGIKRLVKRRFDLILVDCENEQNATEVFDHVHKSTLNRESITIAVIDGKSGLTGAFRLGTNLVVTKPVSLEQAKTTLRTALKRLSKEFRTDKRPERQAIVPGKNTVPGDGIGSSTVGNEPTQRPYAISSPVPTPRSPGAVIGSSLASQLIVEKESVSSSSAGSPRTTRPAITGIALSFELPPTSTDGIEVTRTAMPEGTLVAAARIDTGLDDDDPTQAELRELEGVGSVPPQSGSDVRQKRRRSNAPFLAAAIGLFLGANLCLVWITQPKVRGLVEYGYQALRGRIAGYRKQAPPANVSITPVQPPPQAANNGVSSSTQSGAVLSVEAVESSAPSSNPTGEPAPAGGPATSARALPTDSPSQDVQSGLHDGSTGVFAPATLTAEKSGPDTDEPMVLPAKVAGANVVHTVRPVYPKRAKQKRVQGTVKLRIVINKDGKVDSVHTLDGNLVLARAAVDAVKQWRYKPFLRNKEAVAVETQVSVVFNLP